MEAQQFLTKLVCYCKVKG